MTRYPFVCTACGSEAPAASPWSCPGRDLDDADHVLAHRTPDATAFEAERTATNPYVAYRERFSTYICARASGWSDQEYVGLVETLDRAIEAVDGAGFRVTPLVEEDELAKTLGLSHGGSLWVKDETRNVTHTHKARHLVQALVHLEWMQREGLGGIRADTELAIASCGNAALAAATLARAAARPIRVFIPETASGPVVERLRELGATLCVAERRDGELGDPCYLRFREAVSAGAIPFSCQGPYNAFAIEGGMSLGYELIDAWMAGTPQPDHLFLQVGGGAFASACISALREAVELGVLDALPRLHAVQTAAAHPLLPAYNAFVRQAEASGVDDARRHAASHRGEYMRPWPSTPHSIAHGILDDETYDWRVIVEAIVDSGGSVQLASEETLHAVNAHARRIHARPYCHTGTSGLAGVATALENGTVGPEERVGAVLTGMER